MEPKRNVSGHHAGIARAITFARGGGGGEEVQIYTALHRSGGPLFIIFLDDSVLLILKFCYQIPNILIRLLELHLVHAFALVPV